MTALFTVDCTCGRKVVIDSDTMRRVEAVSTTNDIGRTGAVGYSPNLVPTRRVSLVDDPEDAA